jgi:iron complex outermembrane receptor protein
MPPRARCWAAGLGILLATAPAVSACGEPEPEIEQLAGLDIEELMQIKVTLPARRPQTLGQSAAAVQVITNEDIRRSGAITLPETLRLVPGLDVAQINSSSWAISARGFNSNFANKLLVLIDGRSIYTPLSAGVSWDAQDTLLEDIDRIEVIRRPGASLWGANAVNGVNNIITRSAADTQGLRVSGGGGTEERAFGSVRQGGALGAHAFYRVWGKYFLRDELARPDGTGAGDDFHMLRGGLRLDWSPSDVDHLEVQGELFKNGWGERFTLPSLEPPFTRQVENRNASEGGHVRARWSRRLSDRAEWELQAYYDQIRRYIPEVASNERLDTFEVDFHHHTGWGERQELVWGASYRRYCDDTSEHFLVRFEQPRRTLNFFSAFVQDELALVVNRLRLTVGSKLEHTDTTGFEVEPTLMLLWSPARGRPCGPPSPGRCARPRAGRRISSSPLASSTFRLSRSSASSAIGS